MVNFVTDASLFPFDTGRKRRGAENEVPAFLQVHGLRGTALLRQGQQDVSVPVRRSHCYQLQHKECQSNEFEVGNIVESRRASRLVQLADIVKYMNDEIEDRHFAYHERVEFRAIGRVSIEQLHFTLGFVPIPEVWDKLRRIRRRKL